MPLLYRDDDEQYENIKEKGFPRYRHLLEDHAFDWLKISIMTALGALPLAAAIAVSVMSSSILLLFPLSFLGGMIFGPFYSCMFDNILRGLREEYGPWKDQWLKAFRQNLKESLIPGGIFGLITGAMTFMGFLLYWQTGGIPLFTAVMYFIAGIFFLSVNTVFWSLLVLFAQPLKTRLISTVVFLAGHLWRVLAVSLLQMIMIALTVLFAPWTLFIVPLLYWYFRFLTLYHIYDEMDEFFHIEERFREYAQNKNS